MDTYIIYKITCKVNQKVYIGFTSKTAEYRFAQHLKDAKNKQDLRKFYCAIRKYGDSNFCVEALEESTDFDHAYNTLEQHYIDKYNSIAEGYNTASGGVGVPGSRHTVPVDLYRKDGTKHSSFDCLARAAEFIGVHPARISTALSNHSNNKATKVSKFWIAPKGANPIYKTTNHMPGVLAASKVNTGKKRPEHSSFMRNYRLDNGPRYIIPEGSFPLEEAMSYYGRDMLIEWCRKNPQKTVTKMMVSKSKFLSLETHSSWIGKTRSELGFAYQK